MKVLVIAGPNGRAAKAFSAELLAGCAGYPDAESFMVAASQDASILAGVAQVVDPVDQVVGDHAARILRERMAASGFDLMKTSDDLRREQKEREFEDLYRAGQGAILLQAARKADVRRRMTAAAVSVVAAITMNLVGGVNVAMAQDSNNVTRTAKDTIGGIIGAALGRHIGGGTGKTLATVVGAAGGVLVAESLQGQSPNARGPGMAPTDAQVLQRSQAISENRPMNSMAPSLHSGPNELAPDKKAKILDLERRFLRTRDDYTIALFNEQQVLDDVMLDPRNAEIQQKGLVVHNALKSAEQQFVQGRSDFVKSVEYFGARGYDVAEFAFSHRLAYSDTNSRDLLKRDMSKLMQARAAQTVQQDGPQFNP